MLIFFRLLIEYTEDKGNDADRWKGYVYVVCMVVVATLQVTAVQHSLHIAFKSAMRVHTSIIGVVYAKVRVLCQGLQPFYLLMLRPHFVSRN